MNKNKTFRLQPEQLKPLAEEYGACIASDAITVDGEKVGFMYREDPDNDVDSGWRFLSGTESDEFLDDPENLGLYDVNTIANYDSEIIPLLDAPSGAAYERDQETGEFVEVVLEDDDGEFDEDDEEEDEDEDDLEEDDEEFDDDEEGIEEEEEDEDE
jgi:hypothetical protein